jgi:putative endonuclease
LTESGSAYRIHIENKQWKLDLKTPKLEKIEMKAYKKSQIRINLGRWGENRAAEYLTEKGYALVERNFRTPYGEIDLIVRREADQQGGRPELVFVEVKTRRSATFGDPEVSVSSRKQAHLLAAVQRYMQDHPDLDADWRIDVIAIHRRAGQPDEIVHLENAVSL